MRTEAGRRERFLPYRYARAGIEMSVTRCLLDETDEVIPDTESHLIELDFPWTNAALNLSVHVPEPVLQAVLPPSQTPEMLDLLLVVRCPATFLRFAIRYPHGELENGAKITLRRDQLSGAAQLQAFLVRSQGAPRRSGFASTRGARLADSRSWELRIDRRRMRAGQHLEVRYHPFSTEPTVPARDRKNLYLLRMDQETPEIWLNSDHEQIAAVLDSRGTVGRIARIREVVFDQIAQGVWTQLFLRAAGDYVQSREAIYAWQEVVLDLLLRDVFPEERRNTERRDRLAEAWEDLPSLLVRLDAALQRRSDMSAHLSRLVEQAEDGR